VGFRRHLLHQSHAASAVGHYLRCIGILADMMTAHSIALVELDEAQAVALIAKSGRNRRTYATFTAKRFVRFLNERGIAKQPLPRTAKEVARGELKRDYEIYLRRQRGLSERTIFHSWRFADRFLEFRFGQEIGDLSQGRSVRFQTRISGNDTATPSDSCVMTSSLTLPCFAPHMGRPRSRSSAAAHFERAKAWLPSAFPCLGCSRQRATFRLAS
jgi:hypothetical protein